MGYPPLAGLNPGKRAKGRTADALVGIALLGEPARRRIHAGKSEHRCRSNRRDEAPHIRFPSAARLTLTVADRGAPVNRRPHLRPPSLARIPPWPTTGAWGMR